MTMDILIEQGKRKVKIQNDGFDNALSVMKNGWQWTGFPVDDELLLMMRQAIHDYFTQKYNHESTKDI